MILIIDLVLLVFLLSLYLNIERKWRTIYISQDPTKTHWNHIYIDPNEDASIKLQAALDFLGKRRGGTTQLDGGIYELRQNLNINHPRRKITMRGVTFPISKEFNHSSASKVNEND